MVRPQATARVIRLPTRLTVRCPSCRHQATIAILLEHVGKLKCSKCGHHDPIVAGREPLRTWSRYRRGGR
jgi:Zn ribbon nucleic-acid-binding protein